MALTLSEILDFEPFRRSSARAVAGEHALDRTVRWVHISEMPNPGRLFTGGELLLTQGRGIGSGPEAQRQWVAELAKSDVAGAAVETGVAFAELPRALVRAAQQAGLPLIELHHPAYFMDMTQAVHSTIVNAHYGMMRQVETISREFSGLILRGATLGQIVVELSRIVGNPVVLEDEGHQIMEYAPQTPEVGERLRDWNGHVRIGHEPGNDASPTRTSEPAEPCVWVPIVVRGETWGRIHVLELQRTCDEVGMLAVDRAAAAIGMSFANARDHERLHEDARSAVVQDALRAHYPDATQIRRRASAFGADLSGEMRVVVLRPLDVPGTDDGAGRFLNRRLRVVSSLAGTRLGADGAPLVGYDGGQVVAIVPQAAGTLHDLGDRCAEVVQECATRRERVQVVAGLSDPADLAQLPRAFAEAEEAVRYAVRQGRGRGIVRSGDLGIDRLLLELDRGPLLARHVERELGPLLDHDAKAGTPLLPTLDAFLESNGAKSPVARQLGIERRSLYYRLERIERLVNGSLDDAGTRLRLHIALRGLHFQDARTARARRTR
ncbi:PucR family transcriptional regulator [Streptomonospora sediminis]